MAAEDPPSINVRDLLCDIRRDKGGWRSEGYTSAIAGRIENGVRVITYTFDSMQTFHNTESKITDVTPMNRAQREAVEGVFKEIEKVANVKFRLVGHMKDIDKSDIRFLQAKILLPGFGKVPGGGLTKNSGAIKDVIINNDLHEVFYSVGEKGYGTVAHEILHALGLSHPGGNANNISFNKDVTIMSYVDGENPKGIAPLDIAALQYLYQKPAGQSARSSVEHGHGSSGMVVPRSAIPSKLGSEVARPVKPAR